MMDAAYIERLGPAAAIKFGPLPVPQIGPTDVLVAVDAVAVNPVDTFVRSGGYRTPTPFPFIIGRDLVGTVVAVGDGATNFAVGDAVWSNSLGHGGRQGSFAQFAVVAQDRLYHLPAGVDPIDAVGAAHMAATAWLGLFRHGHLRLGETIYVGGAAGNVGHAAVSLAAAAGARVIASASGPGIQRALDAGADRVFDYRDPELFELIRQAAPEGLDIHWDTSGHHNFDDAVGLMAPRGRILLTAAGPQKNVPFPVSAAYTRDISMIGFAISNASVRDLGEAASALNQRLLDGTLAPRIAQVMPLADAAEAHRLLEEGGVRGRLILQP